jgi:hypothetical protein
MGAQLADQLFPRALHSGDKAAGKGHHQKQADGEK